MKNLTLILFTLLLLTNYACKKEAIPGCTDPESLTYEETATMDDGTCIYLEDLFIGDWKVKNFFYQGADLIQAGIFRNLDFEFENDGDFQWTGQQDVDQDGSYQNSLSNGNWSVDFDKLTIKDAALTALCAHSNENGIEYNYEFESANELKIEPICGNRIFIRIILIRD